jgi:hypothetical protein
VDPAKVEVVAAFLREAFPGRDVHTAYAGDQSSQFYWIGLGASQAHRIYVSREFLDDHAPDEIHRLLADWPTAAMIRTAGLRRVIIANHGVEVVGGLTAAIVGGVRQFTGSGPGERRPETRARPDR